MRIPGRSAIGRRACGKHPFVIGHVPRAAQTQQTADHAPGDRPVGAVRDFGRVFNCGSLREGAAAQALQTAGQSHAGQARAREGLIADALQAARKGDACKTAAIEGEIVDVGQTCGQINGGDATALKGAVGDHGNAGGKIDFGDSAFPEGAHADGGQLGWQLKLRDAAALESARSNGFQRGGQGAGGRIVQVCKGTIADGGDALPDGNRANRGGVAPPGIGIVRRFVIPVLFFVVIVIRHGSGAGDGERAGGFIECPVCAGAAGSLRKRVPAQQQAECQQERKSHQAADNSAVSLHDFPSLSHPRSVVRTSSSSRSRCSM